MNKLQILLYALTMLLWCSTLSADDGIVIKFIGSSSSSVTVPVDGKIIFTSEGVKVSSTSTVKAFADFSSISFSPDRSAIQTISEGSVSPSSPKTSPTITIPATHSAVKVIGQSEPEPELIDIGGSSIIITGTYPYTGSAITPTFRVVLSGTELTAGTDYTSVISNNINPGIAKVTITGKGNYTGTKSASFFIDRISLEAAVISGINEQYDYTGSTITPQFRVMLGDTELTAGTDYTSEITDNINPGIAKVTITGTGNYTGTKSVSFIIGKISLETAVISGVNEQYYYTGSAIEPTFSVKHGSTVLTAGTDYTSEITNNIQPGTATITVTGTGSYNGTVTKQFEIVRVKNVDYAVIIDNTRMDDPADTDDTLVYSAEKGTVYLAGTNGNTGDTITIVARPNTGYEMYVKNFLCILADGNTNVDIDTMKTTIIDDVFTTKFLMPTTGTVFMMFEFKEKLVSAIDGIETCDDAIYQVFDARGMLVATGRKQDGEEIEELLAPLADGLYIIKVNNKTYKIYKR